MNTRRIPILAATATLATLLAIHLPMQAQGIVTAAAGPSAKSFQQLVDHLGTLGYRDVREIERKSDKLCEVKARDAAGVWVELVVDARSGEVLKTEIDDDKHRR